MAAQQLRFRNNLSSWLKLSLVACGVLQFAAGIFAFHLSSQIIDFTAYVSPSGFYDMTNTANSLEMAETAANFVTIASVIVLLIWVNRHHRAWGRPKLGASGVLSLVVVLLAVALRLLAARRETSALEISNVTFDPIFALNLARQALVTKGVGFIVGAISTVFVFLYVRRVSKRNWI